MYYSNRAIVGNTPIAIVGLAPDGAVLAVPVKAGDELVRSLVKADLMLARGFGEQAPAAWEHAGVFGRFAVAAELYDGGWKKLKTSVRLGTSRREYALVASGSLSAERAAELAAEAFAKTSDPAAVQVVPAFAEVVVHALCHRKLGVTAEDEGASA